jgi:hypothetical protein
LLFPLAVLPNLASADLLLYYDFEDGTDSIIENLGSRGTAGTLNASSSAAENLFGAGAPGGATPGAALVIDGRLGDLVTTNLSAEALAFYKPAMSGVQNEGRVSTYTAAFWARLDAPTTGDRFVIGQVTAPAGGTGFLHEGIRGNKAHLGHYANDSTGSANLQTGQWAHLTFRVANGSRTIFVNGVKDSIPSLPGAGGLRNSADIIIGAADGTTNRGFTGAVDDLVIYDEALTEGQIAFLATGGDPLNLPVSAPVLYTAQTGPGGTWNLYQLVGAVNGNGVPATWWNAHNAAITKSDPTGTTAKLGHLPFIGTERENETVRIMASGMINWLGGTDNNTSFTNPARAEGTFFWANATSNSGAPVDEALSFTKWGANEPNNTVNATTGQTGEDAITMRADGFWNDSQSGIPGTGESEDGGATAQVIQSYLIEWDTESANPVAGAIQVGPVLPATLPGTPGSGTFAVRNISGFTPINTLYEAGAIISSGAGTIVDGFSPTVNFSDPENLGNRGYFPGDNAFPGDTGADDNYFITVAKARIQIDTAGDYTFGVFGDDNWALRIVGQNWTSSTGAVIDPYDATTVASSFAGGSGLARVLLTEGTYEIELVHLEQTGGAQLELFAAPGVFTSRNQTQNWRLVGHEAGGTVNLPTMKNAWAGNTTVPPSATLITTTALADTALTNGPLTAFTSNALNFADPQNAGGGGLFGSNNPFPNDTAADDNDFALEASGTLVIPADGLYQIGFRGDDGGYLTITGGTFLSVVQAGGAIAAGNATRIQFAGTTGDSFTTGNIYLTAGEYPIRTVFFERSGGAHYEVFAGQGFNVELLASGGVNSKVDEVAGIPLVGSNGAALAITEFVVSGTARPSLTFSSKSSATCTVQRSTDLNTWVDVLTGIAGDPSGSTSVIDSSVSFESAQRRYFYRVILE